MDLMPDKVNCVIEIALFMSDSNEKLYKDKGNTILKTKTLNLVKLL